MINRQQDPLDIHWTSGTAEKPQPIKLGSLWFKLILQRFSALFFVHLVCALPLSRIIYCNRVYRVKKLEEIVNKMLINCLVLQLVTAGKRLCLIPTRICIIFLEYTTMIHQLKRLVIQLWLYNNTILCVKEKLVLIVLFLGNLIY